MIYEPNKWIKYIEKPAPCCDKWYSFNGPQEIEVIRHSADTWVVRHTKLDASGQGFSEEDAFEELCTKLWWFYTNFLHETEILAKNNPGSFLPDEIGTLEKRIAKYREHIVEVLLQPE